MSYTYGCGDLPGISDAVLLLYFSVLSGGSVLHMAFVAGEEDLELPEVWCEPGSGICSGLFDLPVLSRTDVPWAAWSAGDGELL